VVDNLPQPHRGCAPGRNDGYGDGETAGWAGVGGWCVLYPRRVAVPGVDRDKVVESIREVREVILQVEANESDVRQAVASLARDIELERLLRIEEQVPGGSKEGRYGKEKGYVH